MKNRIGRYFLSFAALIGSVLLVRFGLACYGDIVSSVHFYDPDQRPVLKVDFGRVPQQEMVPNANYEPVRGGTKNAYAWSEQENAREEEFNRVRARNFEVRGQFRHALRAYEMSDISYAFIQDRKELFERIGYKDVRGLRTYLYTGYILGYGNFAQQKQAVENLSRATVDPRLLPHIAYLQAGAQGQPVGPALARRYWEVYRRFPKHPRAESAMIMAIRSMLSERDPKPDKPTPEELKEARGWIDKLLTRFPKTRFRFATLGWLGRCEWLSKDVNKALGCYLLQRKLAEDDNDRWHVCQSIVKICALTGRQDRQIVWLFRERSLLSDPALRTNTVFQLMAAFPHLTSGGAKQLQKELRQDPDLLRAYLTFRIEYTSLSPAQERNLLSFATTSLAAIRHAPGDLVSRVAQLNYNAGQYRSAEAMARRAMFSTGTSEEEHNRAQYVFAASQVRLGRPKAAMEGYRGLIRCEPPQYLKQSALEHLAILEERYGDPVHAMTIYRKLDYGDDIAYMADARLTPEQLERYIGTAHLRTSKELQHDEYEMAVPSATREVLLYTLGMRYLRQERYAAARRTFRRLSKKIRSNWGMTAKERKELTRYGSLGYDNAPPVRDPLAVVTKLERWTRRSRTARTKEERAKALYEKAAYIYHERNLLFYSPGLWEGRRAMMIDIFWSESLNTPADENALHRHEYEHECLAQSLRICDELVRKYPKSKFVPKALYTAAISAEKLSNFNQWWRDRGGNLLNVAINRANRLVLEFPHDPLAKKAQKYGTVFKEELQQPRY